MYKYLLTSANDHVIITTANFNLSDSGWMKMNATHNLPKIWKNAPAMEPFDLPINMSIMSTIWKSWTALKTKTSNEISEVRNYKGSINTCIPTCICKKSQPAKLMLFTILSIY